MRDIQVFFRGPGPVWSSESRECDKKRCSFKICKQGTDMSGTPVDFENTLFKLVELLFSFTWREGDRKF